MNTITTKKIFFLILFVFSIGFFVNVDALSMARVTNNNGANVYYGNSSNSSRSAALKYNDSVTIISTTKYKGTGCSAGYYMINYNGKSRYICSSYVSTSSCTVRVNASNGLYVKDGPASNYSNYTILSNNKMVTLSTTTKYKGIGCKYGYYKINYNGSTKRYICSDYTDSYNSKSKVIITNTNGSKLRTSLNSDENTIALTYNQSLTLATKTLYKSSNSLYYYKVYYKGNICYISTTDVLNTNNNGSVNNLFGVNIRESTNTSSSKIISLNYGGSVSLVNTTKYKGAGCSAGWYKIKINGKTGYTCSSYITKSSASTYSTANSNIRNGPGTNYSKITTLGQGDKVFLNSVSKVTSSSGCSAGWYKISINAKTGYICSSYTTLGTGMKLPATTAGDKFITRTSSKHDYYYSSETTWTYRISEYYANIWNNSSGSSYKEALYIGTPVSILGTYGDYYKINYYNGRVGYTKKFNVEKHSSITSSNSSYCSSLVKKGFPKSYCSYLSYLHSKYPNWVFKPDKTGISFYSLVYGESGKNATQSTNSAYRVSSNTVDSGDWYRTTDGYNAYLLDPRNYLTERNIFAFEDLHYNSLLKSYYNSIIRNIVPSSSKLYSNTYIDYFIKSGSEYDISPSFLVARVKQEGGTNNSYYGVSGNVSGSCSVTGYICSGFASGGKITDNVTVRTGAGTNYSRKTTALEGEKYTLNSTKKYTGTGCSAGWYSIKINRSYAEKYNFYNIGAYRDDYVGAQTRGIQVAAGCKDNRAGTPWNTPYKGISYGASIIDKEYVEYGQDTLYFQKFNVSSSIPSSDRYAYQYMTNILAPVQEGYSVYNAYKNLGVINKGLVFKIPVYTYMPSNTTHPPVGSNYNYLSSISINGVSIPNFDKKTSTYTMSVTKGSFININAVKYSSLSKITTSKYEKISSSKAKVTLKLRSQTGLARTYTININFV